jgi:hypothetical protein
MTEESQETKVRIVVHPGGRIEVAPDGVKGEECTDVTKFLENLGEASLVCHTDEYYEQSADVDLTQ